MLDDIHRFVPQFVCSHGRRGFRHGSFYATSSATYCFSNGVGICADIHGHDDADDSGTRDEALHTSIHVSIF